MTHNKKSNAGAFLSGVIVATAVGGYFLFGSKNAKKNRRKVEDYIEEAKTDVMVKLKKVKRLSKNKYYEIVDEVSDKYAKVKEVGEEKADEFRDKLKSKWKEIEKEAREAEDGK